jgi:hypothetical protein
LLVTKLQLGHLSAEVGTESQTASKSLWFGVTKLELDHEKTSIVVIELAFLSHNAPFQIYKYKIRDRAYLFLGTRQPHKAFSPYEQTNIGIDDWWLHSGREFNRCSGPS